MFKEIYELNERKYQQQRLGNSFGAITLSFEYPSNSGNLSTLSLDDLSQAPRHSTLFVRIAIAKCISKTCGAVESFNEFHVLKLNRSEVTCSMLRIIKNSFYGFGTDFSSHHDEKLIKNS
ncbi:CLUMA_CG021454, isoform A [Clunio marinus]|uniref:CLUMA_CG021454, isoform A n=1 Tax=Clunio marinus TaxID=568069 RepID=A0A1J1JBH0_9DIPT|nr:CLUMA_CG021454, isoform A [Clunio marinus]